MLKLSQFVLIFFAIMVVFLKFFFIINEKVNINLFQIVELCILTYLLLLSFVSLYKEKLEHNSAFGLSFFVELLFLLVLLMSFIYNFRKSTVTGYDAIALYDARALFMRSGLNFSQIANIAPYDNLHKNFYISYPPLTSLVHFFWYKLNIPAPVGVFYSICFFSLAILFYVFLSNISKNKFLSGLMTFLLVGNPMLYSLSLIEYSNMPHTLYISIAIILFLSYSAEKKSWMLLLAGIFLSGATWVRFSEPFWVLILFCVSLNDRKLLRNKYFILICVLLIFGYLGWNGYTHKVFSGQKNWELSFSMIDGSYILTLLKNSWIVFVELLRSWGWWLFFYLTVIVFAHFQKNKYLKFSLTLCICNFFLFYFGLIFMSVNSYWWVDLARSSVIRSSLYLYVVSLFIFGIITSDVFNSSKLKKLK